MIYPHPSVLTSSLHSCQSHILLHNPARNNTQHIYRIWWKCDVAAMGYGRHTCLILDWLGFYLFCLFPLTLRFWLLLDLPFLPTLHPSPSHSIPCPPSLIVSTTHTGTYSHTATDWLTQLSFIQSSSHTWSTIYNLPVQIPWDHFDFTYWFASRYRDDMNSVVKVMYR